MSDRFTWEDGDVTVKRRRRRADQMQEESWSCGPAALVNACAALSLTVSEERVRDLSDADKTGTDERQLMAAADALGLTSTVLHGDDPSAMWTNLVARVTVGQPCLLCVDDWDHWITAVGVSGDRVVIRDPQRTADNVATDGVHLLSEDELMKRWQHDEGLYAIALREAK